MKIAVSIFLYMLLLTLVSGNIEGGGLGDSVNIEINRGIVPIPPFNSSSNETEEPEPKSFKILIVENISINSYHSYEHIDNYVEETPVSSTIVTETNSTEEDSGINDETIAKVINIIIWIVAIAIIIFGIVFAINRWQIYREEKTMWEEEEKEWEKYDSY